MIGKKLPLFRSQYNLAPEIRQSIRNNRLNQDANKLAKALRDYGTGHMPNLWPHLSLIRIPTLILVGEKDKKVCSDRTTIRESLTR